MANVKDVQRNSGFRIVEERAASVRPIAVPSFLSTCFSLVSAHFSYLNRPKNGYSFEVVFLGMISKEDKIAHKLYIQQQQPKRIWKKKKTVRIFTASMSLSSSPYTTLYFYSYVHITDIMCDYTGSGIKMAVCHGKRLNGKNNTPLYDEYNTLLFGLK